MSTQLRPTVTIMSFSLPSTRRIGRPQSIRRDEGKQPVSGRLERKPSGLGSFLFGRRDRSGSKESKESEDTLSPREASSPAKFGNNQWDDESQPSAFLSRKAQSSRDLRNNNHNRSSKDEEQDVASGISMLEKHGSQRFSRKLRRNPSKMKMFNGSKSSSHDRLGPVMMTDEMIRLETVIQSDKGRQRLVQELLALRGDFSVKVRFCSAVEKFDSAVEEQEQRSLANSLIQTFLAHGCLFYISSLSTARYHAIVVDGNYNQLLDAKREVLDELTRNPEVMRIVDHVETLDD